MPISIDAAAEVYRDAVRGAVKRHALFYLIQASLMVVAGIVALVFPLIASQIITLVLGWLLVASGVIQVISLVSARHTPDLWLQVISAVLALLIGFLILRFPSQTLVTFSLLIVVFFMIDGLARIVWSLTIRPLAGWYWVLLAGTLSIVLSIVLVLNIETAAPWLLSLLVGLHLLGIGTAIGFVAWTVRTLAKRPAESAPL